MENNTINTQAVAENTVTFSGILKQSWIMFKSFFQENLLFTIGLLILLFIPLVNLLVLPVIVIVAGRKIQGEANPFVGAWKIYFSKFWKIIALAFVTFGMLIWKAFIWVLIPLVLWGLLKVLSASFGINTEIINIIMMVLLVAGFVVTIVFTYKYMFGWSFSLQALLFEDKKNNGALKRSWELTLGHKWGIFFYILGLGLVTMLIVIPLMLIIVFIFGFDVNGDSFSFPIIQYIISAVMYLFMFIFYTNLYFQFKNNFGKIKLKVSKWLRGLAIAFVVLIPVGILASIVLTSLQTARDKATNENILYDNSLVQPNEVPQDQDSAFAE